MSGSEVHIWAMPLDGNGLYEHAFRGLLSPGEAAQADRFRLQPSRSRYIAARGGLRVLLGRYLNCDPTVLEFAYGPRGKPSLGSAWSESGLRFNVSHSGSCALYAFTVGRNIGVDLEHTDRRLGDRGRIAGRFFAPGEYRAYCAVQPEQRRGAFFNCWTRKEAFTKALGEGLSYPLGGFEVTLLPGEEARLVRVDAEPGAEGRWSLCHLCPAEGYVGAAAVEGSVHPLHCWAAA